VGVYTGTHEKGFWENVFSSRWRPGWPFFSGGLDSQQVGVIVYSGECGCSILPCTISRTWSHRVALFAAAASLRCCGWRVLMLCR